MSTYQDLMKRRLELSKATRSLRSVKAHASAKNEITSESAVKAALLASVVLAADLVPGKGKGKPGASVLESPDSSSAASKKLLSMVVGSKLDQKGKLAEKKFPHLTKDAKLQELLNKKKSKLNDTASKKNGIDKRLEDQFAKLAKTGVEMADNALAALRKPVAGKQDALFSKVIGKQLLLLGRLDRLLMQLIAAARTA